MNIGRDTWIALECVFWFKKKCKYMVIILPFKSHHLIKQINRGQQLLNFKQMFIADIEICKEATNKKVLLINVEK